MLEKIVIVKFLRKCETEAERRQARTTIKIACQIARLLHFEEPDEVEQNLEEMGLAEMTPDTRIYEEIPDDLVELKVKSEFPEALVIQTIHARRVDPSLN